MIPSKSENPIFFINEWFNLKGSTIFNLDSKYYYENKTIPFWDMWCGASGTMTGVDSKAISVAQFVFDSTSSLIHWTSIAYISRELSTTFLEMVFQDTEWDGGTDISDEH